MRSLKFLLFFVLFSVAAFGQGATATGNPVVVNGVGQPMAGVTVAICNANPGTSPATLCSGTGLATLYTDITVTTACTGTLTALNNQTNPTVGSGCSNPGLSDGQGNVVAFSTAGTYWCEYTGSNIVGIAVGVCVFPALSGGASLVGDNVSIQVAGGVISATNPFNVGTVVSTSPNGISAVLFNGPDPFCMYNNLGQDQLSDCLDPANGSSVLAWNPDGKRNRRMFSTIMGSSPFTPGESVGYDPNYGDFRIGAPIAIPNQVQGGSMVSGSTYAFGIPDAIRVSGWCNSGVSGFLASIGCSLYADESTAIKAIVTKYGGSQNIIDDMCGIQTWSSEPLANSFSGIFADAHNCGSSYPHKISLDGMASWTVPSNTTIMGMGANSFAQNPNNSWVEPCFPAINNCVNGGWSIQSATITGFTVAGDVGTITVAGTPFDTNANHVNTPQPGRLLCIYGSTTQVTDNNCWFVKAIVSATAPQQFSVWVVSGVTASCTPGTCGTVYLEQPVVNIGTGNGGAAFHSLIENFTINCNYFPAAGGFVNSQGEENTGTAGFMQAFNCPAYYYRFDQSGAYAGAAAGDTNSEGSGALAGNFNNVYCTKAGGCTCPGVTGASTDCSSSTTGVNGTVPQGSLIGCGTGLTVGTVLYNGFDPCWNQNFVGMLVTGLQGNQGPGRFKGHLTMSISDKSQSGGHPIPQLEGGTTGGCGSTSPTTSCPNGVPTTGCGIGVAGSSAQFDHTHVEYFSTGFCVGGNSARDASLEEEYGGVLTAGVHFDGGFSAFNSGGVGFDLGQSGNAAFVTNVRVDGMNIGLGSGNAFVDNINGNTCSDQTISYELGNATNPVIENTCSTGKAAMELPRFMVKGAAPTCAFTSGGGSGGTPSCTVDTGSTDTAGIMILTTGTTASGTGTVTLTFTSAAAFGTNKPACEFNASDGGAGNWNGLAVMKDKVPSTASDLFTWTNGTTPTALSNTTAYWINYHCWAK